MRSSVCCFLPQSSPCQAHLELFFHFLKGLGQSQSCQEHTAVYTIWLRAAGAAHVPSCLDDDMEGSCASPQALPGHPGALPRGEKPELQPTWLLWDTERSSWEGPGVCKPAPSLLNSAEEVCGGHPGAQINCVPSLLSMVWRGEESKRWVLANVKLNSSRIYSCSLTSVWLWVRYFTSPEFSGVICKVGRIIKPTSRLSWKVKEEIHVK